jgi:hypothetical protein
MLHRPQPLRVGRVWRGRAPGLALTLLKPAYNLWQMGVAEPQTLAGGTRFRVPTVGEAGALVWDPNIGLLQGFPVLLVVVLVATVWMVLRVPLLRSPWPWALSAFALTIVVSAAQTTNMNSSATPSMSRYALMLIPLAIPLLVSAQLRLGGRWEAVLVPLVVVSIAYELSHYHPRLAVNHLQPTPLADFLWTNYPDLYNPPLEVFFDRTSHVDGGLVHRLPSIGTPTCSKVLLREGRWPFACSSDAVPPPSCRRPDHYCYANREGRTYRFVEAAPHYYSPLLTK